MKDADFCCYEFNEYHLDVRRRTLSKNGEKIPLPSKNFDLLLYMVENDGRILEHDELLTKVWAGTFVEQATLTKGVSALRQILDHNPEHEFIRTIPRRGYSFVSPVRVITENREFYFVRETERQMIVEEYEETDEPEIESTLPEKIIEIPANSINALPSAKSNRIKFSRLAIFIIIGVVAFLLLLFGLSSFFSKTVQPQFSVENIRVNRITSDGKSNGAVISPDGNYLLYSVTEKEIVSLYLRQMSTNSTSRLTQSVKGSFYGFAFAPDNSYIYYILSNQAGPQKSGLYKVPLLGGESRQIKENVGTVSVSPDGKRLALVSITDKTNIFTVNTDGNDEHPVSALPANLMLLGISWTPDSKSLLCTISKSVENKPTFYVSEFSVETARETIALPEQEKIILGAVWLPDKSAILVTVREPDADIRQIWQYFPAASSWRRVTNDNNSYKFISLSQDGKSIVTSQESRLAAIWVTDDLPVDRKAQEKRSLPNGSDNFRQITNGDNNFDWLGWLADDRIVYSITEDRKELIYTINVDGTNSHRITDGEDGIWLFPSSTGNGRSIAFLSSRTGLRQVWRIDEDAKNLAQITHADWPIINARILNGDSAVVYKTQQTGDIFLFKQSADGQLTQLTTSTTGEFAVSTDETLLAAETADEKTGKNHIELHSLTDGRLIKTFDFQLERELKFTPDGKNLAYDTLFKGVAQIMIQPLDGSDPYPLTNFQTDKIFSFGWSPDGAHFAVIRGRHLTDAVLIK